METIEITKQALEPLFMLKQIIELQAKVAELQAQIDALKGAA
jgi:hypothetical protein